MRKYCHSILLAILLVNIGSLFFSITASSPTIFQDRSLQTLKADSFTGFKRSILPPLFPIGNNFLLNSREVSLNQKNTQSRFSIHQQQDTTILNQTIDEDSKSFEFIPDIWGDLLGSDTYNQSLYTDGLIDPLNNAGAAEGASIFTRIGNHGNNETTADETLLDDIENISAGWQIEFPIQDNYSAIHISFKWRFDSPDGGFDDYDVLPSAGPDGTDLILDNTPDYQEIRCRIEHPDSNKSFWLGNETTPNRTVFYRVGSNITGDEIWYTFEHNFQVESQDSNFTLELGAYLNTREYWNEYYDVWFDEILIIGIDDIPDNNPPQPTFTGLDRTIDISRFKFWANFSEGTWESPIKNVTVFYELNSIPLNASLSSSLQFNVNEAGYNQTHWYHFSTFNFNDSIDYNFTVFDKANNSYTTGMQNIVIGDYTPPEITSTVINQTGTGFIHISMNTSDWGRGIDFVEFNYTIDGVAKDPFNMTGDGIYYQTTIPINYSSTLKFGVLLTDDADNSDFYHGHELVSVYPIVAENDIVYPEIQDYTITPSQTIEGRTNVTISALDAFGDISEVYLEVRYEDGTPHENYSHVTLTNSSIPGLYKLKTMGGEAALKLPYSDETYTITFVVIDKALNVNKTQPIVHVIPDILAPRVSINDIEYLYPGLLRVWVQAGDLGSGIDSILLQKSTKDGWTDGIPMISKENKFYADIQTGWIGNEQINFRINAIDNEGNEIDVGNRPTATYNTKFFFTTNIGLLITEIVLVTLIVVIFSAMKVTQLQQLRTLRRRRFDIALRRSERLAYLGEEAMFGFVASYGQSEGVSSILLWEPELIGHFYQYLKELVEKANNNVAFIMNTKAQDLVTYTDFKIEEIGCSAITFAYPVSSLPQKWLSILTLDQVPAGAGQGVLLLMLLMREKWSEISHNFQEEIADGMLEMKDLILSGEDKEAILHKAQEFRLFISGTLEVLDEIETETDEISDDIMADFESEFSDIPDDDVPDDEKLEDKNDTAPEEESDDIGTDFESDLSDKPDDEEIEDETDSEDAERETDEVSDDIMADFESEFLDIPEDEESEDEADSEEAKTKESYDAETED